MFVYRIGQTRYASDLKGSGIEGRWNSSGNYVIYTAGSCALACLEKLAHSTGTSIYAGNFSLTVLLIPPKIKIKEISAASLYTLNPDWSKVINYPLTQQAGDSWLSSFETPVLKVPSAIIDLEYNYLLNPAHPDFSRIKIKSISRFTFDGRLK